MKKRGIVVPSQEGQRGIPPGVGSSFPKGKKRGIVIPSELGNQGKPKSSYPGGRSVPVIFGGD
jgi:hypothetical protein